MEQPLFAGRFRVNDSGELEVVANDSGIRLIEARTPMTMAEFLSYKSSREDAEDELVFWKTIDEHSPQYSPLFYVQVLIFLDNQVLISCFFLFVGYIESLQLFLFFPFSGDIFSVWREFTRN